MFLLTWRKRESVFIDNFKNFPFDFYNFSIVAAPEYSPDLQNLQYIKYFIEKNGLDSFRELIESKRSKYYKNIENLSKYLLFNDDSFYFYGLRDYYISMREIIYFEDYLLLFLCEFEHKINIGEIVILCDLMQIQIPDYYNYYLDLFYYKNNDISEINIDGYIFKKDSLAYNIVNSDNYFLITDTEKVYNAYVEICKQLEENIGNSFCKKIDGQEIFMSTDETKIIVYRFKYNSNLKYNYKKFISNIKCTDENIVSLFKNYIFQNEKIPLSVFKNISSHIYNIASHKHFYLILKFVDYLNITEEDFEFIEKKEMMLHFYIKCVYLVNEE